jgi:uncharacterized membrane protein required for colicin V production
VYGDSFAVYVDKISVIVVRSISFIITFLAVYIVLIILSDIINLVFKLPGLNFTNRMFGGAAGILKSVIMLYILFALCSPIIGFMPDNSVTSAIKNSESGNYLYENNVILNYLSYMGFYEN